MPRRCSRERGGALGPSRSTEILRQKFWRGSGNHISSDFFSGVLNASLALGQGHRDRGFLVVFAGLTKSQKDLAEKPQFRSRFFCYCIESSARRRRIEFCVDSAGPQAKCITGPDAVRGKLLAGVALLSGFYQLWKGGPICSPVVFTLFPGPPPLGFLTWCPCFFS